MLRWLPVVLLYGALLPGAGRPPAAAAAAGFPQPVPGLQVVVGGTDGGLWTQGWDGRGWSGWTSLPGGSPAAASAPALASWGPGRLDLFDRRADGALGHAWYGGGAWAGWEDLGGQLTSAPAVATWASGRLDVLARGTDGGLWHRFWDAAGWSGWEGLGGGLASAPAVASWAPGRLDVFVEGTDGRLWHRWWADAGWSGWEQLGGVLTSAPASVAWGPNRLDVFARGDDDAAWHRSWSGGWSGWEGDGGVLASAPAVASWGPGQLALFAAGGDGALWYRQLGSGGWSGWRSLGGRLTAAPAAAAWRAAANTVGGVPFDRQVYALSCEEAALQMAIAHQGIGVSQAQVLGTIGVDARPGFYAGGVLRWGDPYAGFVGDPNGSEVALTGYGTYFSAIQRAAATYGANVLAAGEGVPAEAVYDAVLQNHPVVAWVSFDWRFHPPGSMLAFDGRWVQWEGPAEHAVAVVGVAGGSVLVYNPWFGPQWVGRATFEAAYATYRESAVVLQ